MDEKGHAVSEQEIPLGPAASQVAIKQLGTNGGGFFNANSAHPLENPTPLSNFWRCWPFFSSRRRFASPSAGWWGTRGRDGRSLLP